jgi:hypothetical protein
MVKYHDADIPPLVCLNTNDERLGWEENDLTGACVGVRINVGVTTTHPTYVWVARGEKTYLRVFVEECYASLASGFGTWVPRKVSLWKPWTVYSDLPWNNKGRFAQEYDEWRVDAGRKAWAKRHDSSLRRETMARKRRQWQRTPFDPSAMRMVQMMTAAAKVTEAFAGR